MSKLFVENLSLSNDNPMSTCYPLRCDAIIRNSGYDFYNIAEDKRIDTEKYKFVIFGCRSLYFYKCYKRDTKRAIQKRNLNLLAIKNKFFIIQDMHPKTYGNIDNMCSFLNSNNINIIFTFFQNKEAAIIRNKTPRVKHFHLPLHIDITKFNFMNLEKKYDILLYGAIHPRHYPFRKRLFELVLNNKHLFNIHHIVKPNGFDPDLCEVGLSKIINMSKICIATKSRYDYLVGKYFEIALGKTLIAGDIPTDGLNLFKGRILELNDTMTNDDIIEKLVFALKNYDAYTTEITYLHDYVNKNYGLDMYVEKLGCILSD